MSFQRIWPAGLPQRSPVSHDALTQLDVDHANAVDGANGGEYAGIIRLAPGGRVVPSVYDGSDTDITPGLGSTGGSTIMVPYLTANRVWTLKNTGAYNGDRLEISAWNWGIGTFDYYVDVVRDPDSIGGSSSLCHIQCPNSGHISVVSATFVFRRDVPGPWQPGTNGTWWLLHANKG